MKNTLAYLYKWTEISSGKWYIGARYATGCYPDDGYLCTSKIVKPMILENKDNWQREILCIGDPQYIVEIESAYLTALNAKDDPLSFNKHNGDGKFSTLGKPSALKGKVGNRKGKKNSAEHNAKASAKLKGRTAHNKGKPMSEEQKEKIRLTKRANPIKQSDDANRRRSLAQKGRKKSPEHNAKVSAALQGKQRTKVVCRISDKKEMCLAHFNRYNKG